MFVELPWSMEHGFPGQPFSIGLWEIFIPKQIIKNGKWKADVSENPCEGLAVSKPVAGVVSYTHAFRPLSKFISVCSNGDCFLFFRGRLFVDPAGNIYGKRMQTLQHSRLFWELSQVNSTALPALLLGFSYQSPSGLLLVSSLCSSLARIPFRSLLALKKNTQKIKKWLILCFLCWPKGWNIFITRNRKKLFS